MKRNDQTTFSSPVRAITPCRPLIFRQHDTDSIPTTQRRLHAGRCSRETGTLAKQTGMMLSFEIERLRHIHRETSNPYTEKRVTLLEILIEDALAARLEEKEMELEALKEDAKQQSDLSVWLKEKEKQLNELREEIQNLNMKVSACLSPTSLNCLSLPCQ